MRYPHLPMLRGKKVLLEAVAQGVEEGVFGVRVGERTYFREKVLVSAVEGDAVVVREVGVAEGAGVKGEEAEVAAGAGQVMREGRAGWLGERGAVASERAPSEGALGRVREYRLRVGVTFDRMGAFLRGVVGPLWDDGAEVGIEIIVHARSEKGIGLETLKMKVQETLQQIGAEVKEEEDEVGIEGMGGWKGGRWGRGGGVFVQ